MTRVFVSAPSVQSTEQRETFAAWTAEFVAHGCDLVRIARERYRDDAVDFLREEMRSTDAVVAFGFRAPSGSSASGCTDHVSPWVHLEAGMAVALDLPLLVLAEPGICEGVFEPVPMGASVFGTALGSAPEAQMIAHFLDHVEGVRAAGISSSSRRRSR